jgi:hypothetical protein
METEAMADYCIVNQSFWSDPYTSEELSADGKLVYLYLMTNSAVNIAGIYEISKRRIAFETGVPDEEVGNILRQLGNDGKIVYDGRVCWLCNFHKYHKWNYSVKTAAGVVKCVNAMPAGIVRDAFVRYFSESEIYAKISEKFNPASGEIYPLQGVSEKNDTPCIPHIRGIEKKGYPMEVLNIKYKELNMQDGSAPDGAGEKTASNWWSCMKEEADRGEAFSNATGLKPIKGEFGRWQKDLRAFTEAGISIETMLRAVERMKRDGLTISAPGSVFKVARSIAAEAPAKGLSDDDILRAMGGGHD